MSMAQANDTFDWRRFGLLLRNDVAGGYRGFLIRAAAIAGVIVAIEIVGGLFGNSPDGRGQFWWFYVFLYGWGIVIAGSALTELHDRTKNESFLLLPASMLEKTLARFALVTLGFYGFFLVFATVLALVTQTVDFALLGRSIRWFPAHGDLNWIAWGNLFVVQSVFFLGAAWFRKAHVFKTALAVAVLGFGFFVFGLIVTFLLLPQFRDGWGVTFHDHEAFAIYAAYPAVLDALSVVVQIAYYAGLPLLCCFVAWLRVKETQVSHGV